MNPEPTLKLPPMPARIAKLPRNARGYPVPFFVAWIDGKPDFRMVRPETAREARQRRLCWICGEPLGTQGTFALGPMCSVNRVNSEPPSHRDCAEFAVKVCPFIIRPQMERREDDFTRSFEDNTPGIMIKRNPGVMALWSTREWKPFSDGAGGILIRVGDPTHVSWWREGRTATREEVEESIRTGLPILLGVCRDEEEARGAAALDEARSCRGRPNHQTRRPVIRFLTGFLRFLWGRPWLRLWAFALIATVFIDQVYEPVDVVTILCSIYCWTVQIVGVSVDHILARREEKRFGTVLLADRHVSFFAEQAAQITSQLEALPPGMSVEGDRLCRQLVVVLARLHAEIDALRSVDPKRKA